MDYFGLNGCSLAMTPDLQVYFITENIYPRNDAILVSPYGGRSVNIPINKNKFTNLFIIYPFDV